VAAFRDLLRSSNGFLTSRILELKHKDEAPAAPRLKFGVIGPRGVAPVVGVTSPALGRYTTWDPIEATPTRVAPLVFVAGSTVTLSAPLSSASLVRSTPPAAAVATSP
jgi:NhaP-type Na+/H+ or K+/H+ antiporter